MSSGRPHSSEFVDAAGLGARESELSRRFKVADLPRLAEFAVQADSEAELQGRFHLVDGRCGVAGQVAATLRVTCQRCLRATDLALNDRFHIVLVRSEDELNELPETQDSVIADAAHLDLAWLTEEQLLLALPLVPLHASAEECDAQVEPIPSVAADEKQTPFAQLRELLNSQPMMSRERLVFCKESKDHASAKKP